MNVDSVVIELVVERRGSAQKGTDPACGFAVSARALAPVGGRNVSQYLFDVRATP